MTKYRVGENPYWMSGGVRRDSDYFTGGEVVSIPDDRQTDSESDYLVMGSNKDPMGHHYINAACLTPLTDETEETQPEPERTEPIRVWSEHLADIARALRIMEQASADLNAPAPSGEPGHYSDLTFELPKRVPITIGDSKTGWALVYDEDVEAWMAEFGA